MPLKFKHHTQFLHQQYLNGSNAHSYFGGKEIISTLSLDSRMAPRCLSYNITNPSCIPSKRKDGVGVSKEFIPKSE